VKGLPLRGGGPFAEDLPGDIMKILIAFIIFAALSLFVIMKGGDKIDMSGEKHGTEAHAPEPAASAPAAAASAVAPAASAAK